MNVGPPITAEPLLRTLAPALGQLARSLRAWLEGRGVTGYAQSLLVMELKETMPLQISLTAPEEVDAEVVKWLQRAYEESC